MRTFGIILIVAGMAMMIFTGFTLVTKKEVADIGPLEINKTEKTPVNWSPIVGGILLVAGIVIIVSDKKKA